MLAATHTLAGLVLPITTLCAGMLAQFSMLGASWVKSSQCVEAANLGTGESSKIENFKMSRVKIPHAPDAGRVLSGRKDLGPLGGIFENLFHGPSNAFKELFVGF